eukprot:evm.model.NODE_6825_length_32477_cov_17.962835.3
MPAVPLPDAHGEGIKILVELIQQGDRLDDHVVRTPGIELDLWLRLDMEGRGGWMK